MDLINSELGVVNFSDEDDVFVGILYDWDRMLRVGGHVVIICALDEGQHRFSGPLRDFVRRVEWRTITFPSSRYSHNQPFVFQKVAPLADSDAKLGGNPTGDYEVGTRRRLSQHEVKGSTQLRSSKPVAVATLVH